MIESLITAKSDKAIMRIAMNDIEQNSCIRFVKRSKETDFVRFFSGDGCSSRLGKIGGMQNISLQRPECMSHGTIIHELVHALGFGEKFEKNISRRGHFENLYRFFGMSTRCCKNF